MVSARRFRSRLVGVVLVALLGAGVLPVVAQSGGSPDAPDPGSGTGSAGGLVGGSGPSACLGAATEPAGFSDVAGWAVDCLVHYGVTVGMGDGSFGADLPASRWHVLVFMWRAAPAAGLEADSASDGAASTPGLVGLDGLVGVARAAVDGLARLGILDGVFADGSDPRGPVTGAELVVLLHRFLLRSVVGPGGVDLAAVSDESGSGESDLLKALAALESLGVLDGFEGLEGNGVVSRESLARLFARVLGNTNARPAGVSVQLFRVDGRVEAVVSVRDENNLVPKGRTYVDVFLVPGTGERAFDTEGACARVTRVGGDTRSCRISPRDRVDDNGNLGGFVVRGYGTVRAWVGDPGDAYIHTGPPAPDGSGGSGATAGAASVPTTEVRVLLPGATLPEPPPPPPPPPPPVSRPAPVVCVAPEAPTNVLAQSAPYGAVVSWTAPSNGCPLSGFLVEYKKTADTDWTPVEVAASAASYTFSDLESVAYEVRVTAINSAGSSAPSVAASVTPGSCPQPVVTLASSDGGLVVSWTHNVAVCADSGFLVEYKKATDTSYQSVTKAAGDRSHSLTMLDTVIYSVRVTANSATHPSMTSTEVTRQVIEAPDAPTNLAVSLPRVTTS